MISVGNVELDAMMQELQLQVVVLSERNVAKAAEIASLKAQNAELVKKTEAKAVNGQRRNDLHRHARITSAV